GQFFRQFALTISASMMISAINAMTLTPARANAIFAGRRHGSHEGREALPWWFFAVIGSLITVWLLWPYSARFGIEGAEAGSLRRLGLTWAAYAALFLPGAVVGGIFGWVIIRPVNWILGQFFRAFNFLFELATRAYGRSVGWCLRLSAIVLLLYGG